MLLNFTRFNNMNGMGQQAAGLPSMNPQDMAMMLAMMESQGGQNNPVMPPASMPGGDMGGLPPMPPAPMPSGGGVPPIPPELLASLGLPQDPMMGGGQGLPAMMGGVPSGIPGFPSTDPNTYAGPAQQAVSADQQRLQAAAQQAMQTAAMQLGMQQGALDPAMFAPTGGSMMGEVEGSLNEVPGSVLDEGY
jgi:hypothetical protein